MKRYIILFLIIFCSKGLYPEFGPWTNDLKTGDSLYNINDGYYKKPSVFNGAQGGAFFMIRFFQIVISPQDGPNCRHIPTCSTYGKHAVIKHGAFLGSILAGERLLRCNPFYPPEKDPVPDKVFK